MGRSRTSTAAFRDTVQLDIEDPAWTKAISKPDVWAGEITAYVLAEEGVEAPAELSLVLTSDAEIQELNAAWRGKDYPTNVLSFPQKDLTLTAETNIVYSMGDAPISRPLGDIVMAYDTVAREAKDGEIPFEVHATHLLVHGLLHLLGYDHEQDADAETMERREALLLAHFGIDDPYRRTIKV